MEDVVEEKTVSVELDEAKRERVDEQKEKEKKQEKDQGEHTTIEEKEPFGEERAVGRPSSSSFSVARDLVGSILDDAKISALMNLGRNLVSSAVESAIKEINVRTKRKMQNDKDAERQEEMEKKKQIHRRFGRKLRCVPEGSVFAMITITRIGDELHVSANVPSAHHSACRNKIILSADTFAKNDKATNMVLEHLLLKKLEGGDHAYKFVESVFGRRFSGARGVRFAE